MFENYFIIKDGRVWLEAEFAIKIQSRNWWLTQLAKAIIALVIVYLIFV